MYEREKINDIGISYCGFSIEQLVEDHQQIKKQIKSREKQLDIMIIGMLQEYNNEDVFEWQCTIEGISQEMGAVNL